MHALLKYFSIFIQSKGFAMPKINWIEIVQWIQNRMKRKTNEMTWFWVHEIPMRSIFFLNGQSFNALSQSNRFLSSINIYFGSWPIAYSLFEICESFTRKYVHLLLYHLVSVQQWIEGNTLNWSWLRAQYFPIMRYELSNRFEVELKYHHFGIYLAHSIDSEQRELRIRKKNESKMRENCA